VNDSQRATEPRWRWRVSSASRFVACEMTDHVVRLARRGLRGDPRVKLEGGLLPQDWVAEVEIAAWIDSVATEHELSPSGLGR